MQNNSSIIEMEAERADNQLTSDMQLGTTPTFTIELKHITNAISALKNKNSAGLNDVSNKMIKLLPKPYHTLIWSSFKSFASSLCSPPHWHVAKMILLSKTKTNIVNVCDTRLILLLPYFSKLYEKIFLIQLHKWVNDNGILPDEQTGFRPGHNMAVRLVSIIDQIGQCLALNTAAAAIFVDFKAAFNQLWYKGLWLKLYKLNCPTYLIAWLRNYLAGRAAYIEIKETKFSTFTFYKGVPQGSCMTQQFL
ncbi:unnamed protein product [Rotaria socialis]